MSRERHGIFGGVKYPKLWPTISKTEPTHLLNVNKNNLRLIKGVIIEHCMSGTELPSLWWNLESMFYATFLSMSRKRHGFLVYPKILCVKAHFIPNFFIGLKWI